MSMLNNLEGGVIIHGGNFAATRNYLTINNYWPAPPPAEDDAASRVLRELTPNNMRAIHRDKFAKRAPSTGDWFITNDLEPWYGSLKMKFWAYGDPGTGKSTLLALAIYNLEWRASQTKAMSVCYYYCDHTNETVSVADVLSVLLRQHIERDGDNSFAETVEDVLKRHKRENVSGLSQSELEMLLKIIAKRRSTFYLLDALDEFPARLQVPLIKSLSSLGARLIITSRKDKRMEKKYRDGTTFCKVRARDVDIDLLLDDRIANSPELADLIGEPRIREEIGGIIKANCNGMFLHAALQIDALWECPTIEAARKALADFPSKINQFYGEGVKRMMARPETVDSAKLGLVCLLTAFRPITIQDLQYVLAFDPDAAIPFNTSRILPIDTLLTMFRGLVSVDQETQRVGFIHATARKFLMDHMKDDPLFQRRHDVLARTCTARLESLSMHRSTISSTDEYNEVMSSHPLLAYADKYWAKHAHASADPAVREIALHFIDQCTSYPIVFNNTLDHLSAIHIASRDGFQEPLQAAPPDMMSARTPLCQRTPLMLAASNGHRDVVSAMLESSIDPNEQDSNGFAALIFASEEGHVDVVRLLLGARGTLVNQGMKDGWTALMFASQNGHTEVVRLLLGAVGINVNQALKEGWTALMFASGNGHTDIVRLLLAAPGILANQAHIHGWTPLMLASGKGHTDIVRLLLDHAPGILVNQVHEHGWSSLMFASQNGHVDVVRLLLHHTPGTNVNQAHEHGWTSLMLASQKGYVDIVRLLLHHTPGIHVNHAHDDGWTSLIFASQNGYADIVELLLGIPGILVNQAMLDGSTALVFASQKGHTEVVRLLLGAPDIRVNQADAHGWMPLIFASRNNHVDVVRLLLDAPGILVNQAEKNGRTALIFASEEGHVDVVRLLLDARGIKVNHLSHRRSCALGHAAESKHLSVLKQLIDHPEINVHLADNNGDTPLEIAVSEGHDEIIQLLQEFISKHPLEDGKNSPQTSSVTGHPPQEGGSSLSPNDEDGPVHNVRGDHIQFEHPFTTRNRPTLPSNRDGRSASSPHNKPALAVDDIAQPSHPPQSPGSETSQTAGRDLLPSNGSMMNLDVEQSFQHPIHDTQQGSSSAQAINREQVPPHSSTSTPPRAEALATSQRPRRRRRDRLRERLFGKKGWLRWLYRV